MKLEEAAKATQAMQEYIERHLKEPLIPEAGLQTRRDIPRGMPNGFSGGAGMSPF